MSALPIIDLVDALYERAVVDPDGIDDHTLADWMEQAGETVGYDRDQVKALRKVVRQARKLAAAHSGRPGGFPDWRNGVDEILGARGWEPHLDLARRQLDLDPSPETFVAVKAWHRAVHFTEWMEGVGFGEWRASI